MYNFTVVLYNTITVIILLYIIKNVITIHIINKYFIIHLYIISSKSIQFFHYYNYIKLSVLFLRLIVTVKRLNPKKHPAVYTAGTNQYTPSRTSSQALVIILLNSAESTS